MGRLVHDLRYPANDVPLVYFIVALIILCILLLKPLYMRVSHIILPNLGNWISIERRKPGQRGFSMLPLQACFAQKGAESVFQKVSRERIYAGLRVGFCSVLDCDNLNGYGRCLALGWHHLEENEACDGLRCQK